MRRYRADPAELMRDAGFSPDPWQTDLLNSDAKRVLICAARQCGKSQATALLALFTAITKPRSTTTIVAPVAEQAGELLRKIANAYHTAGAPLGKPIGDAATKFVLSNGSRVLALPGKESRMRSYSSALLIVDEAARVLDPVFSAAGPTLAASGGRFVALSTAFAKSGFFYEQWVDEREPYLRLSITADKCPRIAREFLDAERRRLGERWFQCEYLNVFAANVAGVYRTEDIHAARSADVLPLFGSVAVPSARARDAADVNTAPLFGAAP